VHGGDHIVIIDHARIAARDGAEQLDFRRLRAWIGETDSERIPESRIPENRDLTSLKNLNQDSVIKIQEGGEIPKNGITGKRDSL
jgi:hypothetical protein